MGSQYSSKRILKNTVVLYIRMIVVTIVSFFTVRITLQVLGVEDYGIYNVVGGIVAFLGILSATMSSATQRYLAFDLGRNDLNAYQNTFSLLLLVYCILSLIIIIFGEILGPWIISSYLKIPEERLTAAQWVYQFSLLSFCLTLISTPYQASIIANEKMGVFAFVGLYDSFGKLIVTCLLYFVAYDKLIIYASLIFFISLSNYIIQRVYCRKWLCGCAYRHYWNKDYLKEIVGYTGWNLFGAASSTLNNAGISIVLNLFFGPLVNAAKGIADRIHGLVVSFSVNFYQAMAPQIIKTYAAGEYEQSKNLVLNSSKLSFYLLYVLTLPLLYGMPAILNLWLGADSVTDDMVVFSRLILIYSLVNVFELPITMIIRATGNIKHYQVCVGLVTLCTLPVCALLFYCGKPAYWYLIILTAVYFIAWFIRLFIAHKQVNLNFISYLRMVLLPISIVIALSVGLSFLLFRVFHFGDFFQIVVSFALSCICVWFLGLTKIERRTVVDKLMRIKYIGKNNHCLKESGN